MDTVENRFVIDTKGAPLRRDFRILRLKGELYPQIDVVLLQDAGLLLEDFAMLG